MVSGNRVSVNRRFGIQDIICVAVLTGTATVLLLSKIETSGVRWSPALRPIFLAWWPLLLILIGIVLLFTHFRAETRSRRSRQQSCDANLFPSASGRKP